MSVSTCYVASPPCSSGKSCCAKVVDWLADWQFLSPPATVCSCCSSLSSLLLLLLLLLLYCRFLPLTAVVFCVARLLFFPSLPVFDRRRKFGAEKVPLTPLLLRRYAEGCFQRDFVRVFPLMQQHSLWNTFLFCCFARAEKKNFQSLHASSAFTWMNISL